MAEIKHRGAPGAACHSTAPSSASGKNNPLVELLIAIVIPSLILVLIGAAVLAGPSAHAAGVMIADDAGIVYAKACQVETLMNARRDSIEYWMLPACNFTGNLELSIGGSRTHDDSGTRITGVVLQGKTLFKPLEPGGWGIGLGVGMVRHPQADAGGRDWYAYVPASFSFRDDRFVLHTNIGWLREQEARRDRFTWGLGSETRLAQRTWLIAETFGQHQGRPQYQVGVRHWLAPDRAQIEVTYGDRFGRGAEEHWFSVGLHMFSPRFLP